MILIDDLLLLPMKLFSDTCEKIGEMAEEQRLMTIDSIKRKFQEIQLEYEEGRIGGSEYQDAVKLLSDRLDAVMRIRGERNR